MKLYGLDTIDIYKNKYIERGGEVTILREGVLLDDYIMHGPGLKTLVAKAKYLNAWSSAYTIRMYNKTPQKYEKSIL